MKKIDPKQKRIIWALWKKELGYESDLLYARIFELYGVNHMSDLTYTQADAIIRDLRRVQLGLSHDRLSPDQYRAILSYASYLGWDDAHLQNYMLQQVGVEHIKWLTGHQARAILTGLEKIKQHNLKKKVPDGI